MSATELEPGPGLFESVNNHGEKFITNIRRIAGNGREPGSVLIAAAGTLLATLAGGLLYVTFKAQYQYIFAAKHQNAASIIQALMLDTGMIIFSLLALGLSRAGKSSRTERILIMVCAAASALMSYAASDTASPRSVGAYVAAPVFLAIVVDRVIAVVRRHVLAAEETSAWSALGRAAVTLGRFWALVLLYVLATILAPHKVVPGLRRLVLLAAPVPGEPPAAEDVPVTEDEHQDEVPPIEEEDRASYGHEEDIPQCHVDMGGVPCGNEFPCYEHPLVPEDRCGAWEQFKGTCGHLVPCPDHPSEVERRVTEFATKKEAFLHHYRRHAAYGDRAAASKTAAEIAPLIGSQPGRCRSLAYDELARLAESAAPRRELANGSAS